MKSAKEILDARLDGQDIPQDKRDMAMEEAAQAIRNYCNREAVPWQLNYTWANMAEDIIKARYTPRQAGDIPDNELASIRAGDMTFTRGADFVAHRVNVDELTKTYAGELNNFRRFRWGI
jgi:hypothetical protein